MAVFKRGRKWVARVYDPQTKGQRHVGSFDTKREARQAESDAERANDRVRNGGPYPDEVVEDFVARWPDDYGSGRKESTRAWHREMTRQFARDFAGRALRSVTRPEARLWALGGEAPGWLADTARDWEGATGARGKVVVPAKMVGQIRGLRTMYSDAVADRLADENPFGGIKLPTSRGRKDIKPITLRELEKLIGLAEAVWEEYGRTTFGPMIAVAAYTGLRPGELYALRWTDDGKRSAVDLAAGLVHVREQFNQKTNKYDTAKNHLRRSVVLPAPAAEALRSVPKMAEDDLIWHIPRGAPFRQRNLHYYWSPVRVAFGRREMDFYELRHFCGSYLADMGVSAQDIAFQLGHQDGGKLAMDLYIHTYEDNARERIRAGFSTPTRSRRPA